MNKNVYMIIVAMGLLTGFTKVSEARGYEIIKGKGVEVCEDYLKNINEYEYPMICEREISKDIKSLKAIKWTELDLREDVTLYKQGYMFVNGYTKKKDWGYRNENNFKLYMEDAIKFKWDTMRMSLIDMDNDGKAEKIIKFSNGRCLDTHVYGTALIWVNDMENNVNVEKSWLLSFDDIAGRYNYHLYDAFMHKGATYFDEISFRKKRYLDVYKMKGNKVENVCKFYFYGKL